MAHTDNSVYRCTCGTWCLNARPCTTCNHNPVNTT
jgi:hypothetical protein